MECIEKIKGMPGPTGLQGPIGQPGPKGIPAGKIITSGIYGTTPKLIPFLRKLSINRIFNYQ